MSFWYFLVANELVKGFLVCRSFCISYALECFKLDFFLYSMVY